MFGREDIMAFVGADLEKVKALIRSSLKSDISLLNYTNESILSHPGKMVRPTLAILIARAISGGNETEDTIRFAAASELLHNATLLHDDVADNSSTRRGQPTVMSLLGGRASVLLGDYWLVKAMDNILDSSSFAEEVIRLYAKTLSDLAEGELLQLQKASGGDTTEEDYYRIIYSKTASLFEATAISAAISVGASSSCREKVGEYSRLLGIAFQIKDDIMDYTADASIGKPVGHDLLEQKITLPLLGALKNCPARDAEIRQKVVCISGHPEGLAEIVNFVKENDGVGYAEARLQEFIDRAVDQISDTPDCQSKDSLIWIAKYMANRKM